MSIKNQSALSPSQSPSLAGRPSNGINPRRLFAAGGIILCTSAMKRVASKMNVKLALLGACALTMGADPS